MATCKWHDHIVDRAGGAVLVGAVKRGTGPARPIWACPEAVEELHLLPLHEHPENSDGTPIDRNGRTVWPPD